MNIKPEEITSIIKKEIQRYENQIKTSDSGTIIQIGDGIARVYGLDDCMQGELLEFPNNVFGMALNLEQDNVGCVLLGSEEGIKEGDIVKISNYELEWYIKGLISEHEEMNIVIYEPSKEIFFLLYTYLYFF